MNTLYTALCGSVNLLPLWIMLAVFGAIVLLMIINAIKHGIRYALFKYLLIALAIGVVIGCGVYLFIEFSKWETLDLITFAIRWLPTALFVLTVLIATLFGIWRGLRKSLILALHATLAGALCVAVFFILVNVKEVDSGMLSLINFFMGGDGALQRAIGVPESCSTLKEVLANAVPLIVGEESDIALILKDNVAYVYTLVDMAFRIIIAVLSYIVYFGLVFILYIVYHFCYSQRKYKKNRVLEFKNGKTDKNYRAHRLGGGVVGLVRGVTVGLLSLSFLGSAFFVVAGGKGDGKLGEHDFGNDDANFIYEIYRSIDGYGAQGIFSILNAMTDASDTPFYLFAADLIFSGELNDEEAGVSDNVKFREEFAAYTGFARDTFDLLLKYGADELDGIICGEVSDDAFNTVIGVMSKPEFRNEFNSLIDAFDAKNYIINLSMSLVNSIVSNIDEISFADVGDGEKELLKVIFKKGYLSEQIPDERALIESTGSNVATGKDVRPYLTVNHLITKTDVKTALNVALSIISGDTSGDTMEIVKSIIPEIGKLSILQSERKEEFNPVLGRMYCLFENEYLVAEGETGATYNEIAADGIDWIGEINTLLDISSDSMTLYSNLYEEGIEALDILKSLFDENDANYAENIRIYDRITLSLSDSRVLGRALSTSWFYLTILEGLSDAFENVYLPREIVYNNVYNDSGELVSYGELFKMTSGLKIICSDWSVFDSLSEANEENIEEVLKSLSGVLEKTDGKNPLSYYIVESSILRSVVSVALIESGGNTFYVPKAAREKVGGTEVNLIIKSVFAGLLDNMTDLVDFVMPFVGDGEEWKDDVDNLLDGIYNLVKQNIIFEGTVAQIVNLKLGGGVLTVPQALTGDIELWLSDGSKSGELIALLDSLDVAEFDFRGVLSDGGVTSDDFLDSLLNMEDDALDKFFSSSIIQYTVSKYLIEDGQTIDGFKVIVPQSARIALSDDVLESIVRKSELIYAFGEISRLGLTNGGEESFSSILVKIAKNKSVLSGSKIIAASVAATVVENDDGSLGIPEELIVKGSTAELTYFDSTNPWSTEIVSLINALDEIFALQEQGDGFDISDEMDERISSLIPTLNDNVSQKTRLEILYDSLIVRNKITLELDSVFTEELVDGQIVNFVKIGGYYTYDELKALSDAANALGITATDGFNKDEFDSIGRFKDTVAGTDETVLQVIYRSDIVAGIITKNVAEIIESNVELCDHPYAFRTDIKVYRESEIETLANLYENLDSIEKLDFKNLADYIYDDGETKSYILVGSVSEQLFTSKALIVPHTVVEVVGGKKYVTPLETMRFVDAFNALLDTGSYDFDNIGGFNEDTVLEIPEQSVRTRLFDSEIIRARIVWQLRKMNDGGVLAVGSTNGSVVVDQRTAEYSGVGRTATVSAEQLEYLAAALEVIKGNGAAFEMPDIDIMELTRKDVNDVEKVLRSDLIRYRVVEALKDGGYPVANSEEEVLRIDSVETATLETATAEDIKEALDNIRAYS